MEFLNDPVPGNTRPLGDQSFGIWAFYPPPGKSIDPGGILVLTAHDCGGVVAEVPGTGPFFYPGIHGVYNSDLPISDPLEDTE